MKILSLNNEVSALVLQDIASKFWFQYFIIGLFSALAFVLQVVGISIIIHFFNNNISLPFDITNKLSVLILNRNLLQQ